MNSDKQTRILLIDDDPDFVAQMQIQLEHLGYAVTSAASEDEARARLAEGRPDAVVCDLMLQDADGGFVLAYEMKRQHPDLPIVMVTGVASEAGIPFALQSAGERSWIKADALLPKPVRAEQLKRELDRLLPAQA